MKISLDPSAATLTVAFPARDALVEFAREAEERQAFLLRLDRELKLLSRWSVRLEADEAVLSLTAEVVQLFDTVSGEVATAFEVREWGEPPPLSGASAPQRPEEAPEPDADTSETLGASPAHRIRAMNPVQRAILAAKAGRAERTILLRDSSPQVLQALLANPRLEGKEVLQLVKTTHTTAAILQRVAADGRWGKNQEILTAVARNPKTPSPLAVRLMEKLRTPDLRVMAKMASGLRENVRRAALREYLRRTQKR